MTKKRPKIHKERPPDDRAVGTAWRLFIAVPMPESVQDRIARLTESLSDRAWPVRWVGADAAHLTLHFIGETEPERAELLRMSLGAAIAGHSPFALVTTELGVFPDANRPRVLWLGLDGDIEGLAALHLGIASQLERLGFPVETRRFHPHVTLGRVRENPPPVLGTEVRRAFTDPELRRIADGSDEQFIIREVLLMRSFLDRDGARHEPLARYPLAGT